MSWILFLDVFFWEGFIVQNIFTYRDMYTKHQRCVGSERTPVPPAERRRGGRDPRERLHHTGAAAGALPDRTRPDPDLYSTTRMTIDLLGGCSSE